MKTLSFLLLTYLLIPQLARAEHGPPTAANVDELVVQLQDRLADLADEYFFEPGERPNFDEPRFNRLVGAARIAVERARRHVDRGRVCLGMRWLTRSVLLLDAATRFAIRANMSGSGYSDDLASYSAAIAQFFLEDLIALSAYQLGGNPALTLAIALEELGDQAAESDVGNWSPSLRYYTAGVCVIFRAL